MIAPLAFLDEITSATLPDVGPVTLSTNVLEVLGGRASRSTRRTRTTRDCFARAGRAARPSRPTSWSRPSRARRTSSSCASTTAGWSSPARRAGHARLLPELPARQRARSRGEHVALALDERSALSVSPADRPDDVHLVMPIRLRH
ncbi:hypothetical protein NKG05_16280 [Oerskovia sp. M15]